MRSSTRRLRLIVVLAVAMSACLSGAQRCDFQRCLNILKRPISCSSSREFITCAVRRALQNPACTENTHEQAQNHIQNAAEFQDENCHGATFSVCHHQICLDLLSGHRRTCGTVEEGLHCAETQVLQNPDCPANLKTQTRTQMQQGRQYLADHCRAPAPPTQPPVQPPAQPPVLPPRPPAVFPPAPPPVLPALQLPVQPYLQQQVVPPVPQPGVPAATSSNVTLAPELMSIPAVSTGPPEVCDYLRCLEILANQHVTCRVLIEVRQCAEVYVMQNPVCPPQVKIELRNQLKHEEQYLQCRQGAITTLPPPPTRPPTFPPMIAEPCLYHQCLDLLDNFDLNCGLAIEIAECARRLAQHRSCPNMIKYEARSAAHQAEEYLRDNCEELFLGLKK